jgi:hypothetical protein
MTELMTFAIQELGPLIMGVAAHVTGFLMVIYLAVAFSKFMSKSMQ